METAFGSSRTTLNWTAAPIEAVKVRLEQFRQYRRTVAELSALTDRELNDLGIGRGMIRSLARESVYGG